ncbi:TonB-dependent siderophore receptor [Flavobacterium sp. M31R6]|uniref:TonB-dependent siderophore receptor n=1 Tax=Flavobacterium sp. M31R6 TaxID=2739062 RepID=UPI001569B8E7|nr:TonB-dependent receptor [Flavobacterium sp. M31R6]QKJ62932.1 TonB-dependent receptor [Flavobacterium sp. M31R6]
MKYILLPFTFILFCFNSQAQEVASNTDNNDLYYFSSDSIKSTTDTVKNRKGQVLKEVIVTANQRKNPVSVGKSGIKPMDLPQSVQVITQKTLENQQITTMSDLLKNTNGVYIMGNSGGYQEEIASRGYAMGSSNTFKNGVRYFNGMPTEMSGIEKAEFLKGSAAILFGNVTAGGVLNLVTKKPKFDFGADASVGIGSFDLYKTTFDVFGPIGNSKKVAFRMNGANTQANSFRIGVSSETKYVNPSFLVNFNDKTSLLVEADYIKDIRTPDFGAGIINYELVDLPRSRFVGVLWGKIQSEQASLTATLRHQLSENWDLSFINSNRFYETDLFANTRPNSPITSMKANGDWTMGLQRSEAKDNYWLQELNAKGKFQTWNIDHQVLFGADQDKYKTETLASTYKNPLKSYKNEYDTINIFTTDLSTARNDIPTMDKVTLTKAPVQRIGVFAQDLISINKYVKALAGLRYSYQETTSDVYTYPVVNPKPVAEKRVISKQIDDAFSPRLGLILQPNKNHSIFASYSTSFVPNAGLDYFTKEALAPSTIKQYEVGVKNEFWDGRLFANVTAYQIENNNLAQTSLIDATYKELAGGTKSQGVEIDLVANPAKGLSILGGYSFNEIKYTDSNIYIVGSQILYMPKNTANLNFNYHFEDGKLKGLNLGLINSYVGVRYAGRSTNITTPTDPRKPVKLPEYFQSDATVGYQFKQITIRAKLSNIFNALSYNVHDDNSVNPIAPTNYAITLNYAF